MKKFLLCMLTLLLGVSGVWAQIIVSPSTGVYWKGGAVTSDPWAPQWKSNAKATDGSTSLLVFTGETGMNTATGDIYSNQTYTLEAPAGYVISSYTFNGTATGGDVDITPTGESSTTITSGSSLGSPLDVTVRKQSTTFALSGSGHIESLSLVVTVSPIPVTIAYCPDYTTSGCSHSLPSAYGSFSFSGQTFTTSAASGMDGVTITASSGLTIGEQAVNVNAYGKCFKLVTAAASTDYTLTMTAPTGYVITGYYLRCSANSSSYQHKLTSADGTVSRWYSSPPAYSPVASQPFEVTGLNTNSTSFTIQTANGGNTLYLPIFQIYVAKASEVVNDTYNVMFNGTQVATKTVSRVLGSATAPALPSSLQKSMCTYEYYSDASCTTPLSTLTAASTTVYVKCTMPFTVSTAFNTATWYYLKMKDAYYPTYVSGNIPNVTLPNSNAGDRTSQWAFFGDPYNGLQLKNRAAGDEFVLGSAAAGSNDNNGGSTYATLQTVDSQTYERWFPASSTHYTNGFFLNNGQNYALNQRSTANLAYWTGGKDGGSTFVVEVAPSDEAALAALKANYEIAAANLDKPGFPTTAAYSTFRSTIEAYTSLEQWEEGIATAVSTVNASVIYPNGTYYIKNRNTGCYAFITDDGELLPRIKIDNTTPHNNNNYLWKVTSNKNEGTCSIVSSLYSSVPFAKGNNDFNTITASNRTVITTLSTSLFSGNNGNSGAFYLNGAHNSNVYTGNGEGDGNSHVVSWNYEDSQGSQWIFEPVELGTEWTVTVEGLEEGGQDAVTLSDGTIVNLGTGTAYLSQTPTTSNITQNDIAGYSIQDGSISIDGTNHTITVSYSPSYDVLIANYWSDNGITAKLDNAGNLGYPALDNQYTTALNGVKTALDGGSYTGNATNYENLKTWYAGYLAAPVITPSSNTFWRINSINGANASLQAASAGTRMKFTTTKDKETIFLFDGSHLISYSKGLAVNNVREMGAVGVTGNSFTFEKALNGNLGQFSIKCTDGGSYNNNYLYSTGVNNSDADRNTYSTSFLNQNSFTLEEVTELPVTISGAGYATYCFPVNVTFNGNGNANSYVATSASNNSIHFDEVEAFSAGQGILLKGDEGNYTFTVGGTGNELSDLLSGTTAAVTVASLVAEGSTLCAFQQSGSSDYGFFKYPSSKTTFPGFKAYYIYTPTPGSSSNFFTLSFDDDDVTAIASAINGQILNGQYYDLQGRKVVAPQKGQLYIHNGKKVLY